MTRRLWIGGGIIAAVVLWISQPGLGRAPHDTWAPEIDIRRYQYQSEGIDLINTTALFASWPRDPLLAGLMDTAFGRNIYGANVIPFYRGRTGVYDRDKVTLITWVTADRFARMVKLAEKRDAPISMAVYIPPDDPAATQHLRDLDVLLDTHPAIRRNIDIHLVSSPHMFQLNLWRNVARTFARTDWVLLWDADFEACTDYQVGFDSFRGHAPREWVAALDEGKGALVIPAFEWSDLDIPADLQLCPADKQALAELYADMTLDAFETFNPVLSHATDYEQYFQAGDTDYYAVEEYEMGYENYAIFRKDMKIWFDERFIDWGFERSATAAHMYLTNVDFYILPDQYALHEEHPAAADTAPVDSFGSSVSWLTFRADICHAIAHRLAREGTLHLAEGERTRRLCVRKEKERLDVQFDMARVTRMSEKTAARG